MVGGMSAKEMFLLYGTSRDVYKEFMYTSMIQGTCAEI